MKFPDFEEFYSLLQQNAGEIDAAVFEATYGTPTAGIYDVRDPAQIGKAIEDSRRATMAQLQHYSVLLLRLYHSWLAANFQELASEETS